jgi:hypothetical protein
VRLLTDEVQEVLWWFQATHELVLSGFGAYWRRAWLAGPGNLGEQDAWLWDATEIARTEANAVLTADLKVRRETDELETWRYRKRRELD